MTAKAEAPARPNWKKRFLALDKDYKTLEDTVNRQTKQIAKLGDTLLFLLRRGD